MRIRPLESGDEAALKSLVREIDEFHAAALPHLFRAGFESGGVGEAAPNDLERVVFVAESAGTVAGFVDVRVRRFPETPITVERANVDAGRSS